MNQQQLQPWHIFSAVFVAFWAMMSYFDNFFITLILCVGAGFATDNLNKFMKGGKKKPVVDQCPTKPLPPEPPAVSSDEEDEEPEMKVPDSLPIQAEAVVPEVEPTPSPQLMESVVPPTELLSAHQIPEDIMEIEEEPTKCDVEQTSALGEEDFVEVKKVAMTPHNSFAEPEEQDLLTGQDEEVANEAVFEEPEEPKEEIKVEENLLIEPTHAAEDLSLIEQIEQPPQQPLLEDSLLLSQKVDLLEDNLVAESAPPEIENESLEVLSKNDEVKPLISEEHEQQTSLEVKTSHSEDSKQTEEVIEEEITELKISAKNEEPLDFLSDQTDLLSSIPPPSNGNISTEDSLLSQIEVKGDLLSGMDDSLLKRSEEDDIPVMMKEIEEPKAEIEEPVDLLNIQSEIDPQLVQHVAKQSLEEHEQELANLLNEAQQEEAEPELEAVEKVVKDEGDLWALDEPKLGGESLVHLGDSDELANKDDISHCAVFGDDNEPDLDLDEDEKAPRSLKSSTSSSSSAGPDVDQDEPVLVKKQESTDESSSSEEANPKDANLMGKEMNA